MKCVSMLEKQPHNGQKQSSRGEGSIKWKTYSHLSYHCLFYEVKCFRKSAVLLCKSIGEDDSFATLFPYGGCCWSLDHIKKHTLVFVPRCRHSTALPVSMERTVQPNQMTLFLGLLRTLRPLFFWALLYGK